VNGGSGAGEGNGSPSRWLGLLLTLLAALAFASGLVALRHLAREEAFAAARLRCLEHRLAHQNRLLTVTRRRLDALARAYRPAPQEARGLLWPLAGPVVSGWGMRQSPMGGSGGEFHDGIDLAVPIGTPVAAVADGIVTSAGWYGGYGWYVALDHGHGLISFYGHLCRILVPKGAFVRRGQEIARSGATGRVTGPHLHFGLHVRGVSVDPEALLPEVSTARCQPLS
jgi:murein DD-endopeptidase MepM/ murein hydrolase activator NlpD